MRRWTGFMPSRASGIALACIVIGHRKNANLFMLFIAVSFISIFVVLSLFGAVFSFFAGQATTPYRRQDDDW